jgi:predicted enzyme related to lactoylglutathione lyase
MHGISHVEFCTTDIPRTRAFFESLFGWEFQEMSPEYHLFRTQDGPGGGIEKTERSRGRGDIEVYVHVESIKATLLSAEELGAVVDTQKTEIGGGFGFYAMLREPGGCLFGLWQGAED